MGASVLRRSNSSGLLARGSGTVKLPTLMVGMGVAVGVGDGAGVGVKVGGGVGVKVAVGAGVAVGNDVALGTGKAVGAGAQAVMVNVTNKVRAKMCFIIRVLLRRALPNGTWLTQQKANCLADPDGSGSRAISAMLIPSAPRCDGASQRLQVHEGVQDCCPKR